MRTGNPAADLTVPAGPSRLSEVLAGLEQVGPKLLALSAGPGYEIAKRAFDLVFGSLLLVLSAPVMILAALAVKLTSRGPVLFRQQRLGRHGRVFTMYKFRTMHRNAEGSRRRVQGLNEKDGPVFKMREDPRTTPVGRLLRRSSIDELPQLLNVLKGQMSLVGPRPLWVTEARETDGPARMRCLVKPGLTCLWQISGRSELCYAEWVLLDLYYIRHRSLALDLMILIQTIPAVVSGRGAY